MGGGALGLKLQLCYLMVSKPPHHALKDTAFLITHFITPFTSTLKSGALWCGGKILALFFLTAFAALLSSFNISTPTLAIAATSSPKAVSTLKVAEPKIYSKLINWGFEAPTSTPRAIDTIVIHSAYDFFNKYPYTVPGVLSEFKKYDVSPHYLISRLGAIYRLVKDNDIAYHAGKGEMSDGRNSINDFSIGIELIYTKTDKPTKTQYAALNNLIKYLKSKYEIKNVVGHSSFSPPGPYQKTDPWNFDWGKIK